MALLHVKQPQCRSMANRFLVKAIRKGPAIKIFVPRKTSLPIDNQYMRSKIGNSCKTKCSLVNSDKIIQQRHLSWVKRIWLFICVSAHMNGDLSITLWLFHISLSHPFILIQEIYPTKFISFLWYLVLILDFRIYFVIVKKVISLNRFYHQDLKSNHFCYVNVFINW